MFEPSDQPQAVNHALLVGVEYFDSVKGEAEALLEELEELVNTLGINVVASRIVKLNKPHSAFFLGSGKAQEIADLALELKCDAIIFDNEITPSQQQKWEQLTKLEVFDRQEVILDIFSKRAQTKEAVLQVELARLEYYLPRLKRAWTHLHRQRGGNAVQRGGGEKQIEIDQRLIRTRISQLKRELSNVVKRRDQQRKKRVRVPLPTSAIVGYTNAGKSSLLNYLTNAQVLSEDKLFATLDPTTRRLKLPNGQILLVTDTVGFVQKIPHRLIDAFKATLEEAILSNLLIHVVDVSNPSFEKHIKTTFSVLEELGPQKKSIITVFNKIDLLNDPLVVPFLKSRYPDSCFISTKTGDGIDNLLHQVEAFLKTLSKREILLIPHDRYDIVHQLYEVGAVENEKIVDQGFLIEANIPKRHYLSFSKFIAS